MRYYLYGVVEFATTARRNTASRRLTQRAAAAGFTAEVWQGLIDAYGTWPAGVADTTGVDSGLPGFRFCYSTADHATANAAVEDVAAAWDVFKDSDSWWAFAAVAG